MKRTGRFEAVMGSSVAATLLAGATYADQPASPEPATGSIEQVAHTLGYEQTLGDLALRQEFSFTVGNKQRVTVYNYTAETVSVPAFEQTVAETQALRPTSIVIHPHGDGTSLRRRPAVSSRQLVEHDFVLVPAAVELPPVLIKDDADGAQREAATLVASPSQAIGVVRQPVDALDHEPAAFLGEADSSLPTEICQSFAETKDPGEPTSSLEAVLDQETVCNGFGTAVQNANTGYPFGTYLSIARATQATISIGRTEYPLDLVIYSRADYGSLQAALQPSTHELH